MFLADPWLASSQSTGIVLPDTNWVLLCASIGNAAWYNTKTGARYAFGVSTATMMVNGANVAVAQGQTWSAPTQLAINPASRGEASDFAVAEILVWNRALSGAELYAAQSALGAKYCLTQPVAPPPPSQD